MVNAADLVELEILINKEGKSLQTLKDGLETMENLTLKINRILESFDNRIEQLDPIIMPIYRNMTSLTQIHYSRLILRFSLLV